MMGICEGIAIGVAGGAGAGLIIWVIQLIKGIAEEKCHERRIHSWLSESTSTEPGRGYRSTRAIASWTNLTEDRVRYICSRSKKMYLFTGENQDMWTVVIDGFPRHDNFSDSK